MSQATDTRSGYQKDKWRRAVGHGGRRRVDGCLGFTALDSPMATLDALFVTTALRAVRVVSAARSRNSSQRYDLDRARRRTRLASLPATACLL
jgi:hypothetical protein